MAIEDTTLEPKEFVPSLAPITEAQQYTPPDIGPSPGVLAEAGGVINAPAPDTQVGAKTTALASELGAGEASQYISPEATVRGQLDTILSQTDKPEYIKLAEAKAAEQANKQGMLSTSMAIGAARKGVIETALQVAQPDAATFKESDLATQRQVAESVLTGQRAEEERATSRQQFGQQSALDRNRAYDNLEALTTKGEIDFQQQKLGEAAEDRRFEYKATLDVDIENARISQSERESVRGAVNELDLRHSADLTTLLTNPDLDDPGRRAAIARLDSQYEEDTQWVINSAGMDYIWNGQATTNSVAPEINTGAVDPVTGAATTVDPATNTPITTISGASVDYTAFPEDYVTPVSIDGGGTITDRQDRLIVTGINPATGQEETLPPLTSDQLVAKSTSQDASQGTVYAELAGLSFTDFDDFQSNLANTGVYGTDEYFNFTSKTDIPKYTRTMWEKDPSTGEKSPISTSTNITSQDLSAIYEKVLYASLNPENAEAQEAAYASMSTDITVPVSGSYAQARQYEASDILESLKVDPLTLLPSERDSLPVWQTWLNNA